MKNLKGCLGNTYIVNATSFHVGGIYIFKKNMEILKDFGIQYKTYYEEG